jgi:hypothetical protein
MWVSLWKMRRTLLFATLLNPWGATNNGKLFIVNYLAESLGSGPELFHISYGLRAASKVQCHYRIEVTVAAECGRMDRSLAWFLTGWYGP